MSTLARIRNRSGLLLVVIGVGMLAFIGGDFMSSLGSGGGGGIYVGEVLGEDVLRQDYEVKVEEGINNWKSQNQQSILTQTVTGQIRSQVWDQYIRELVMNNEYSKLGIDVSDDEWAERVWISVYGIRPMVVCQTCVLRVVLVMDIEAKIVCGCQPSHLSIIMVG